MGYFGSGYVQLRRGLFDHTQTGRLSGNDCYAFIGLTALADPSTGVLLGSAGTLAQLLGMPYDSARHSLARLESRGYILRDFVQGEKVLYKMILDKYLCTTGVNRGKRTNLSYQKDVMGIPDGALNQKQRKELRGQISSIIMSPVYETVDDSVGDPVGESVRDSVGVSVDSIRSKELETIRIETKNQTNRIGVVGFGVGRTEVVLDSVTSSSHSQDLAENQYQTCMEFEDLSVPEANPLEGEPDLEYQNGFDDKKYAEKYTAPPAPLPTSSQRQGKPSTNPNRQVATPPPPAKDWPEGSETTLSYHLWDALGRRKSHMGSTHWEEGLTALQADVEMSVDKFKRFLTWAAAENITPEEKKTSSAEWLPKAFNPVESLKKHLDWLKIAFITKLRLEAAAKPGSTSLPAAEYANVLAHKQPIYNSDELMESRSNARQKKS